MAAASADVTSPDTRPRMDLVADGVHAFVQMDGSWGLSNAALVVADDAVVLVDTCFTEARNTALRQKVLEIARRPPTLLVNTHHHGDHIFGNGLFPEALVVSHAETRECVKALDPSASSRRFTDVDFGNVCPTPAGLTFADAVRLHAGDMTLDVLFPGVAHCAGNSYVHVPERSVLIAGDLLLNGCTPTFVNGSAQGFIDVLAALRSHDADVVVPGHGAICDARVIEETEAYVRYVQELATEGRAAGRSPLEVALAADLGPFSGWLDGERIVGNLYRAYAEIDGAEKIDMVAMWADTTSYAGGPLHSWA